MNVLSVLLSNANSWKNPFLQLNSYAQRAREHRQTCFFSQIQPITQSTVIECAA